MRWLAPFLLPLFLASCLASPGVADAGAVSSDAPATTGACGAGGGTCVVPSDCVDQIGDIACNAGTICCIPATSTSSSSSSSPSADASIDAPTAHDAGTRTSAASGCDQTCEAECVSDPNCIQACGC